jgi:hypothetical protein
MKLNVIEKLIYYSYRKVLNGYARVFSAGLLHLDARQSTFEAEVKAVADAFLQASLRIDSRLRALEQKESHQ